MKHILVGLQPTGKLHIGHYVGVLEPAQKLNETEMVEFLIADYHSLTSCSKETTQERIDAIWCVLHGMGFGNLNRQQPSVLKLFWELAAQEPIGNLAHLPQYKTKQKTLGMLTYPLLMAADIIESKATHVLVGEDQIPHMDYYRYIARKNGYPVAESIVIPDSKIMSIKDPTKKMSKSLGDEHCLYLDDNIEMLKKKISKAPTTPKGLKNLRRIARVYSTKFNSKKCKESKNELAESIYKRHHENIKPCFHH